MLKDLIISRVRLKILKLFFANPHQEPFYYVRQIVRFCDEEINAVRRELNHLVKTGILKREPRGNRLYYQPRRDYPIYNELVELFAKTENLGLALLKNQNKLGRIRFAALRGQFARQLKHDQETVDLLVVGRVVLPELAQLIRDEEKRLGTEIHYTVITEEEFRQLKSQHHSLIINSLKGSHVMLVGDEEEMLS